MKVLQQTAVNKCGEPNDENICHGNDLHTSYVFIISSLNLKLLPSLKPSERCVNNYMQHIYIIATIPLMGIYRSQGETLCFPVEGVSQHTKHPGLLLLSVLVEVKGHLMQRN